MEPLEVALYQRKLDNAIVAWFKDNNREPMKKICDEQELSLFEDRPGITEEMAEKIRVGAVCKMATARNSIPIEIRRKAKEWLTQHKFDSWDSGDL